MIFLKVAANFWTSDEKAAVWFSIKQLTLPTMAPSGTNGDAAAILDEIKAPDGVVLPPKEIKG
jgi:hypothetical protein